MSAVLGTVGQAFMTQHPAGAAAVLDALDADQVRRALAALRGSAAAEVLTRLSPDTAAGVLDEMEDEQVRPLLEAADFVRLAGIAAHLPAERRERLLALLSRDERGRVLEALEYRPGTAGQLMDPRVMTFRRESTAGEAMERLRRAPSTELTELLLVDSEGRLTSTLALQALLAAKPDQALAALPARTALSVGAMATHDEVVDLLRRHPRATLAVVDFERHVLGVLRHDALLKVTEQAATDDLQQMVGADKEERALWPPFFTVKSRLPWLLINLATGFLAAAVVGLFDATIAKFTALAVLMPVVAGQAGNTGAQSLAVISRGLALREIRLGHAGRVLRKEALAAAVNGACVALITSLGTLAWSHNLGLTTVIGVSMVGSMVIAALAGAAVPMVLTALKRDPATASSIVLTTITDIAGFSSFLGLATLLSEVIARGGAAP